MRAGGDRDVARHRVSDRLRDRALAAGGRPALPRRGRLRRPRQLRRRVAVRPVVAGPVQHRLHHDRLGRDRARAGDDPGAGHVPRRLRPRHRAHLDPDPLRDHHRGRRVRLVLRLRPRQRLRQRPALRRRRQGLVRRPLERDGGDHRRRGVEDDAVHRPAAARRPDDDRRGPLRGGEGRRRDRAPALLPHHAAADEARDPRRAALPHARRLPRLRLDLRHDRRRPGHRIGLDHRLQPVDIEGQPRPRLCRLGADLLPRAADRLPLRQGLRQRRSRAGRRRPR